MARYDVNGMGTFLGVKKLAILRCPNSFFTNWEMGHSFVGHITRKMGTGVKIEFGKYSKTVKIQLKNALRMRRSETFKTNGLNLT